MVFLGHQAWGEGCFFFEGLGIEPRALCVLAKISTTELHPHTGSLGSLEPSYTAQASLELVAILLLQTPRRWNYSRALLSLTGLALIALQPRGPLTCGPPALGLLSSWDDKPEHQDWLLSGSFAGVCSAESHLLSSCFLDASYSKVTSKEKSCLAVITSLSRTQIHYLAELRIVFP